MLLLLLLIAPAVFAQTYQSTVHDGVCWNDNNQGSPPNYSKNGVSPNSCQTYCSAESLCVGYSHAVAITGHGPINRCAIFIDRLTVSASADYAGWTHHNYHTGGWVENVTKLDGGNDVQANHTDWKCWIRDDTCPAGSMTVGAATISYPELDQGAYHDQDCPPGTTGGPIRVECQSGTTVHVDVPGSTNSCALLVVVEFTDMGTGVCRDHTIINTGTGIGPGVSPPNFSKQPVTNLDTCKHECRQETLLCNGISWNESAHRCALFINTDTAYCGNKSGWETHAYQYGWTTSSEIDGASGEAGWTCYKRTADILNEKFDLKTGTGVCSNDHLGSPPNYSKSGTNANTCANECLGRDDCLGFSHNLADARCAIWMDHMTSLPGLAGWEAHDAEIEWDLQKTITRADGVGSGWLCYVKNSRRKV
eukprot:UN30422